jgi:hypothetical protein
MSAGQDGMKNDINATTASEAEIGEKVTHAKQTVEGRRKNGPTAGTETSRGVSYEYKCQDEVRTSSESTRPEATRWDFETQLAAIESRTRLGGGGDAGTSTDIVSHRSLISPRPGQYSTARSRQWLSQRLDHPREGHASARHIAETSCRH